MVRYCAVSVPVVFLSRERLTCKSLNQLLVRVKLLPILLICFNGLLGLRRYSIIVLIMGVARVLGKVRDCASKRRDKVFVMPFVDLTHSFDRTNHARSLHV